MKKISRMWLPVILTLVISLQAKPHLLIVTIDTFRPDFMGCYQTGSRNPNLTPAIDSLAMESVVFSRCYATSAWTSPGLVSILTGLYPSSHQVTSRDRSIHPQLPTIFKLLAPSGYNCQDICYLTVIPNFYHLGLTPYPEREQYLNSGNEILFHYLKNYNALAPFGLWYHFRDLHIPYENDQDYLPNDFWSHLPDDSASQNRYYQVTTMPVIHYGSLLFAPQDSQWVKPLYGAQVRRMDHDFIAPLIRQLKAQGLWDDLMLIITADHGEELLEHGFVGHGSTSLNSRLYNEILHIPLIIKFPHNQYGGQIIHEMVQQIDLVPTILEYLKIPAIASMQGQSLIPILQGKLTHRRYLIAETNPGGYQADSSMLSTEIKAIFNQDAKLIRTSTPTETRYEFYNLKTDPGEKKNLYPTKHPEFQAMLDYSQPTADSALSVPIAATVPAMINQGLLTTPTILVPRNSDRITYQLHQGAIKGEWTGPDSIWYVLKYQIGSGKLSLNGEFRIFGNRQVFGPFSPTMWNTLAIYNPWVFRVYPEGRPDLTSRRLDFTMVAYQAGNTSNPSAISLFFLRSRPVISAVLSDTWLFSQYGLISLMILTLLGITLYTLFFAPTNQRLANYCLAFFILLLEFHFFTLGVMPLYWEKLYHLWGNKIAGYSLILGAVFFTLFITYYAFKRQTRSRWKILLDTVTLLGLILILYTMKISATRFHIFIYTILGFVLYHSYHYRGKTSLTSLKLSLLIMGILSITDEIIQFYLPIRYFGFDDIGINLISSLAGISLAFSMFKPKRSGTP